MPVDPMHVIGVLGTLSSMTSALMSILQYKDELSEADRDTVLKATPAVRTQASIDQFSRVLTVIPTGIRDEIVERIKRAQEKLEEAIKDPNNRIPICSFLHASRLKKAQSGFESLPTAKS
jgi:hypothetical protein